MINEVDKLLLKLIKKPIDPDEMFLNCIIDLNERLSVIENWLKDFVKQNGGKVYE